MDHFSKTAALFLALCPLVVAHASDVDSELVENASALIAIQLSSELGDGLSGELVEKGMTETEADALVFRVVDGAARCAVRRLDDHEMPQVESFVSLLASSEEMSNVTSALEGMYSRDELNAMQAEVSKAVRDCLQKSMRLPQKTTTKPVASRRSGSSVTAGRWVVARR